MELFIIAVGSRDRSEAEKDLNKAKDEVKQRIGYEDPHLVVTKFMQLAGARLGEKKYRYAIVREGNIKTEEEYKFIRSKILEKLEKDGLTEIIYEVLYPEKYIDPDPTRQSNVLYDIALVLSIVSAVGSMHNLLRRALRKK